jgi:predicted DNA-binding ribbon-helix-helix protein
MPKGKPVTIYVKDAAFWNTVKEIAAEEKMSVSDLIAVALLEYIADKAAAAYLDRYH